MELLFSEERRFGAGDGWVSAEKAPQLQRPRRSGCQSVFLHRAIPLEQRVIVRCNVVSLMGRGGPRPPDRLQSSTLVSRRASCGVDANAPTNHTMEYALLPGVAAHQRSSWCWAWGAPPKPPPPPSPDQSDHRGSERNLQRVQCVPCICSWSHVAVSSGGGF